MIENFFPIGIDGCPIVSVLLQQLFFEPRIVDPFGGLDLLPYGGRL